jgi:hypothetical protein
MKKWENFICQPAFAATTGEPKLVGDEAGIIIEYGDTLGMATGLVQLSEQPALRPRTLRRYIIEIRSPKIMRLIERIIQNPSLK